MKEVTKQERWDFVKDKNVTYTASGEYPFTGLWKDRRGNIVAKDVPIGRHLGIRIPSIGYSVPYGFGSTYRATAIAYLEREGLFTIGHANGNYYTLTQLKNARVGVWSADKYKYYIASV